MSSGLLGKVREMVFGLFKEQCKVGIVWFRRDPSGGLSICEAFSCKQLVSEIELFFHSLDVAGGQFLYEVVC